MNILPSIPPVLTALTSALSRCFSTDQRGDSSPSSRELPELSPWKIIWGAWFTCALLAAFGLPSLHAQFAPATGPVSNTVSFQNINSGNNGFFATINNATKTLSITRPANPTVTFVAPGASSTRIMTYAWVGPAGLLAKTVEDDGISVKISLILLRLQKPAVADVPAPAAF